MTEALIDELGRALARAGTRRAALAALLGVVSSGAAGLESLDAKKYPGKRKARRRRRRRPQGQDDKRCLCFDCPDESIKEGGDLDFCCFRNRDYGDIDLSSAKLQGACFDHAQLNGADFSKSVLVDSWFTFVDLTGAKLRSAKLQRARLRHVDLSFADLSNADIEGWTTEGVIFCSTIMPDGTRTGCVDRCVRAADCPVKTCQQAVCNEDLFCDYGVAQDGTGCGGSNQCRNGQCVAPPTCKGWDEETDASCQDCCSGCLGINGRHTCERGPVGSPCHQDHDCFGKTSMTIGKCRGFVCFDE